MDFTIDPDGRWDVMTSDPRVTSAHARVDLVTKKVLHVLENGPLRPRDVVSRVSAEAGVPGEEVRVVVWKLIDRGFLDPDDALRLSLRRPK